MNAGRKPVFVIDQDCLVISNRVVEEVEAAGMETKRTFDLDIVRAGSSVFDCPIHGEGDCTCQLVILLVVQQCGRSLTVVLEGRDNQTWVYLDPGQGTSEELVDPKLTGVLYQALFPSSTAH